MNFNFSSFESVGSISRNHIKCEHDFKAKLQRAKKDFVAGENFYLCSNWRGVGR